ncbi:hypothetical protein BPUTSESOX_1353 [uncultured Gammaproteobacteria bacterium]|jgi:uncharacterized LabA/DUF88 family protein|nr:hypothetical protein BPUTSESOX_1353 [uncultured Gammaproteobacteria bacterium]
MKKTILLIDAGYLLIVLRKEGISYNANMIAQIAKDCCVADEELHKILYYDCDSFDPIDKKTGKPFFYLLKHKNGAELVKKENKLIAELQPKDLFAVRLGVLKFEGWTNEGKKGKPKFRQKGVDMRIGLDMAHLAHQGKIDRIILITADTDFIPAMKYVRKANIQVVIAKLGGRHLTPDLTMHTDFIRPIKLTKYQKNNKLCF